MSKTSIAAGNELAARIILADPVRYAGLPMMWARMWMNLLDDK
jgi:hypothetical protein